jgi:hypothetical protein
MAVCHYHPDKPGIGICMKCRVVICPDCCTRVDGINHCHACLQAIGQPVERCTTLSGIAATAMGVVILGVAWLLFAGLGWLIEGNLAP